MSEVEQATAAPGERRDVTKSDLVRKVLNAWGVKDSSPLYSLASQAVDIVLLEVATRRG